MPILFEENITRGQVRRNSDRLYVFGDSLEQKGYGGLAFACRGEPNAVGVPTKRAPSMQPGSFFNDTDFDHWPSVAKPAWDRIEKAILEGKTVVFPKGGLGKGLAQLPMRAPRIKRAIHSVVETLQKSTGLYRHRSPRP